MGAKTRVHSIRDVFYGIDLMEGANPVHNEDGTFNIRNTTVIKAGLSKNGNFYSEKVLKAAVPLFTGTQMRTDHESIHKPASVRDVVGVIEKAWWDAQGKAIKAHIKFSSTAEDIMTKVKEGIIGDLSINAFGETVMEKVGERVRRTVQKIHKVFSLDLVCEASAGGSLHEEFRKHSLIIENVRKQMEELENVTLEELLKARPDLVESIEKQVIAKLKEEDEKKEGKKEDSATPSVSKEDIGNTVKEQINSIFKERDEKAQKVADTSALEEAIASAVDGVLKESDVDDAVKVFVRENLIPFARGNFKSIDDIDTKKLSEERDSVLKYFTELAAKLSEGTRSSGTKGTKGSKQEAGLMSYLP